MFSHHPHLKGLKGPSVSDIPSPLHRCIEAPDLVPEKPHISRPSNPSSQYRYIPHNHRFRVTLIHRDIKELTHTEISPFPHYVNRKLLLPPQSKKTRNPTPEENFHIRPVRKQKNPSYRVFRFSTVHTSMLLRFTPQETPPI